MNKPDDRGSPGSIESGRQSPRNKVSTAHYTIGLRYDGLGNKEKAREAFNVALKFTPDYLNAIIALSQF